MADGRAKIYSVSPPLYTPALQAEMVKAVGWAPDANDEVVLRELNSIVRAHFPGARRGDVVEIRELTGYRNHGIYLYDGANVIMLDFEEEGLDDYGHIPKSFPVLQGDFWPNHWAETSHYTPIIWFDASPHKAEIRKNLDTRLYNGGELSADDVAQLRQHFPGVPDDFLFDVKPCSKFTYDGKTVLVALHCDAWDEEVEPVQAVIERVLAKTLAPWYFCRSEGAPWAPRCNWDDYTLVVGLETAGQTPKFATHNRRARCARLG